MNDIDTFARWIMGLPAALGEPTCVVAKTRATAEIISRAMTRFDIALPYRNSPAAGQSWVTTTDPGTGRIVYAPDISGTGGIEIALGNQIRGTAILDDIWHQGIDLPVISRTPRSLLPTTSRLLPGRSLVDITGYGLGSQVAELLADTDQDVPVVVQRYCIRLFYSWPQVRGRVDAVVAGPSTQPWLAACLAAGIAGVVNAPYVGRIMGTSGDQAEDYPKMMREIRLDPTKLRIPAIGGKKVLVVGTVWDSGLLLTMAGQALQSSGARSVVPFSLGIRR